jgi:uncharacterized protein YlxP (DUF503 family)
VTIGLLTVEIHLPQSRSLKDKRQVIRSVKDRLRAHHNVALCELEEDANVWQRASVAVVSVASRRDVLEHLFETIIRETEGRIPGHLVETGREFLEGSDGGPRGWAEELS